VSFKGFVAANHSGLSTTTRTTPRQLASILRYGLAAPAGILPALLKAHDPDGAVANPRVRAKSGTRYLVVRVNSKKKKAVIRVRLTGKSARLLKAKTITIRTNHLVKISTKTLRVPKATKKANVRVLRVR